MDRKSQPNQAYGMRGLLPPAQIEVEFLLLDKIRRLRGGADALLEGRRMPSPDLARALRRLAEDIARLMERVPE